jgi:hypothetical protein
MTEDSRDFQRSSHIKCLTRQVDKHIPYMFREVDLEFDAGQREQG